MCRRRDCFWTYKYWFLLFLFHLSLSRLWQRLIFSRLNILFKNVLLYFFDEIVKIDLSECRTTTCDMIKFVAIVTNECIYLIECENLIHFTIIQILIIRIRFKCLRSRFKFIWLFATWFLIIEVFFKSWFFIFSFDVFEFSIHVSQCLIDELTKTCEFVQIDYFINVRC